MSSANVFQLFPEPNHDLLAAGTAPKTWSGVTPSSTAVLKRILEEDYERWHVFFNYVGFHNHTAHTALALWSLGAHESIIEAAYKKSCLLQRPSFVSPSTVDASNWKEHLGDENYYSSYLQFFTNEIKAKGAVAILEEYIFSANANIGGARSTQDPAMVSRFIEGLIHPLIHTGHGFEFGLPGLVAEGIAQTAVHPAISSKIIPASFFLNDWAGLNKDTSTKNVHALTILARILADTRFQPPDSIDQLKVYGDTHDKHGDAIKAYVDQWTLDGSIKKKVEELVWMNVVIYGIGGYQEKNHFNNDFFHMHLVTSLIFLSPLVDQLNRPSQEILLRAYFATCLIWYIGRGRAPINIQRFYKETTTNVVPPGTAPSPHRRTFPSPDSPHAATPNPWLPILQTTLVHPDDHLVKLQRALLHYASVYGLKSPGYFEYTELNDAGKLDGTLFARTAILTAGRSSWVREGNAPDGFDRIGFYSSPTSHL